ncbi:MAG: hypothetical protein GW774_14090 [Flavobacteriales bacterium]|nr:hypothetical protein [Flavobacteriales bacterium]
MSLLLLAVFYTDNLNAQNAENLFKNYHKWGVTGQLNNFTKGDVTATSNNNFNYEVLKNRRFAFGLTYNFYQYKDWNFKAGIQLQWFGNENKIFISSEETALPVDINSGIITSNDRIVYLPLTFENVLLTKGNINLSLGGGLALSYLRETIGNLTIENNNSIPIFTSDANINKSTLYTSGHLDASIYFKAKNFNLQTSVIYSKSFKSFKTGTYEFSNLVTAPNTRGAIDQSGDFIGLSLTLYFKKKPKD